MQPLHRRIKFAATLSLLAGCFGAGLSHAQTPLGPPVEIVTADAELDSIQAAKADDGSFNVVWLQSGALQAQRFSGNGAPMTSIHVLNPSVQSPASLQPWPLVSDANGNILVGWINDKPYFQLFDASGTARNAPTCAFSDCSTNVGGPPYLSVSMDAAGNFVTAMAQQSASGTSNLVAQRFSAAGAPLDSIPTVVASKSFFAGFYQAHVAMNRATGDFAVGWTQYRLSLPIPWFGGFLSSETDTNYVQRYNAAGTRFGNTIKVGPAATFTSVCNLLHGCNTNGTQSSLTSVQVTPSSQVMAQTVRATFGGTSLCNIQRYNSNQLGWPSGAAIPLTCSFDRGGSISDTGAVTAVDGQGRMVAIWLPPEYDNSGIAGQEFDSTGKPLGSPFTVLPPTAGVTVEIPSISMDPSGNFVVAWIQEEINSAHYQVWHARFQAFSF